MQKMYFIILANLLMFISCTPTNLDDIMSSSSPNPSQLSVYNFKEPRTVTLEWEDDFGAEEYLLYRDLTPNMEEPELIYRGKNLSYKDAMLDPDETIFYYYHLTKRRGNQEYPPSNYVLGIASDYVEDEDNNNTKESAALLTDTKEANLYFYRDNYGLIEEDINWYYINVPAKRSITISITKSDISSNSVADTLFIQEGNQAIELLNNDTTEITINNNESVDKRIYFYIIVNRTIFIENFIGGRFSFYRINFIG